jgi:hypothetical protein
MEREKHILQMLELVLTRQEAAAARQEKRNAEAKARHERFLAFLDALTFHGKRNDDLSDRDNVVFRRNEGCYNHGSYPGSNRGRSGVTGALKGRDKR